MNWKFSARAARESRALFIIVSLSVCSPLFNCLSAWSFSAFFGGEFLVLKNAGIFQAYALVFVVPSSYILYKSRKEIELRFQTVVSQPPKRARLATV
jgi:hypothetical protein